ncbi:uncharacterized protein LOC121178736 isoform X2 [Toxotes jaculatrix]|uniref:uncharacterized protein LOC121178736 isoform X2 n=1 Tax=Toxotes jaculatrix TaxID=941984 RepID=UPI001B3A987A|nr:uncharacterized protein LOC121178736 isoform X2 [Toxotes jaculatrix]
MFHCKFSGCVYVSDNVSHFIKHIKLHSNTHNYRYKCGAPDCTQMYLKAPVLQTHMYREHKSVRLPCKKVDTVLKCVAHPCAFKCDTVTSLIQHLKTHTKEGLEIKCPFRGCDCSFTVSSSFDSHISRKHRGRQVEDLTDLILHKSVPTEPEPEPGPSCSEVSDEQNEQDISFAVDEALFLHSLTLLYLKLQAKLLLPASTIQTIIDHELSRHPKIEEILADYEPETSNKAVCVLLLLMAYFKEPKTSIILEPCATAADVQRTQELPSTPCLIVQGDLMKPRAWLLSIEEQVVMGPHRNMLNGLAALFSSFYNFNLQYPEESSCTLEFIQRCFLGINPESGSKTKRKRGGINAHVSTLMRKLVDFEWQGV